MADESAVNTQAAVGIPPGPGVQIIYCADSLALAVAQIRVHQNEFPESMIATKFLIPVEVIDAGRR